MKNFLQGSYARRPRSLLFLVVSVLIWGSVSLRWITEFIEQNHPMLPLITVVLASFGILMMLEPLLTGGPTWRAHLYLGFQAALVFAASLLYYELDFFALLYLPLCGQAMFSLNRRDSTIWVVILILLTVIGQTIQFGGVGGLSYILLYTAGLIFVAAFSNLTLQSEASRKKSEALLGELQEAHRQLQEYAGQAEALAAAEERNRLARELHDSVAQTLYGLTLQSEAASRNLSAGQLQAVEEHLAQIYQIARQTLQEIRLLIFELRPPILEKAGLAAALRARLQAVEEHSGLRTEIIGNEISRMPLATEMGLFRIAQEALNNTLKHARASLVRVQLKQGDGKFILEIQDNGEGFNQTEHGSRGGLGLQGMRERAEELNGKLDIATTPGGGTSIRVEVLL
jgi:signal transduction histidine kinase